MQALIYSPILSHPATAGNRQAVYHIGKYLQSAGYTVHFVYYTLEGLTKEQYDDMRAEWNYFDVIFKDPTQPAPPSQGEVYGKDDWYQENVGEFLLWKVLAFDIRLVLFHYIWQSKALELLPRYVRKVLHTHDMMSNRHKLFDLHGMPREFFYTAPEEEGTALQRADEIIAVQAEEAALFRAMSGRPVHVLRQYFPPRLDVARQSPHLRRIGYLGSNNLINAESIRNFCRIFRKYREAGCPITLIIAGGVCDAVRELAGDGIEIMGRVERVDEFYRAVDLVINPMMIGTGLKIKTVEALSFGCGIVSTRAGMSGIGSTHPYHMCESADEVAQAIELITRQPTALARLRGASRQLFSDYYADTMTQLHTIFPMLDVAAGAIGIKPEGLTIEAYEFGNRGWYPTEKDDVGAVFRWLGPKPAAEIVIKVERKVPLSCTLAVINSIRPDIFKSIDVTVDGMPIEVNRQLTGEREGLVHFIIPPARGDPNSRTKLAFAIKETISPTALEFVCAGYALPWNCCARSALEIRLMKGLCLMARRSTRIAVEEGFGKQTAFGEADVTALGAVPSNSTSAQEPTDLPGTAQSSAFVGCLDHIEPGRIVGWAWSPDQPNERLAVEVLFNDAVVATLKANRYRADLKASGIGDGRHGFEWKPQASDFPKEHCIVALRRAGTQEIINGPWSVSNSSNSASVPAAARDDEYVGGIDQAEPYRITGWAWCPARPRERVVIDLLLNGASLATLRCDEFRQELKDASMGDGRCSFSWVPDPSVLVPGSYTVAARISGTARAITKPCTMLYRPPALIDGEVILGGDDRLEGWVWNKLRPKDAISVGLFEGDNLLTSSCADRFDPKLAAEGVGNGMHAFTLRLPPFFDRQPRVLDVRALPSCVELAGSPLVVEPRQGRETSLQPSMRNLDPTQTGETLVEAVSNFVDFPAAGTIPPQFIPQLVFGCACLSLPRRTHGREPANHFSQIR